MTTYELSERVQRLERRVSRIEEILESADDAPASGSAEVPARPRTPVPEAPAVQVAVAAETVSRAVRPALEPVPLATNDQPVVSDVETEIAVRAGSAVTAFTESLNRLGVEVGSAPVCAAEPVNTGFSYPNTFHTPRSEDVMTTSKEAVATREIYAASPSRLEFAIGARWTAWVGALVIVLAVGFFVKLAVDQGWWGALPPAAKCLICTGFGLGLVGAGDYALRRFGRFASIGLFGAGLGTLYLTALATFRYFHLVGPEGAFWLMAAVVALGVAITVRGGMLTIGVLSLAGGYLSPVLLRDASAFPAALPLFTSGLLAIGYALATWRPAPFHKLRYVVLALHMALLSLWIATTGRQVCELALGFMAVWWGMTLVQTLLAARAGGIL